MIQQTLLLIKPNATKKNNIGAILKMVARNNFVIEKLKIMKMDEPLAEKFYAEHFGRDFYPFLLEFMLSGKIVAVLLSRENAIPKLRELVGNTDFEKANLGTIRSLYADSYRENSVHASDSPESAKREISLIFS